MTFNSQISVPDVDDGALAARLARSDGLHPPRSLSRADQERFLAQAHVAVLAVDAGPDRPPASIPLWYAYDPGGDVLINTSVSSRKARLIRSSGAATLTVQRATPPYRYVVVEGQVVDVVHPAPLSVRRVIAGRYLSSEGADAAVARYDPDDQVLFALRPQRWHSADFSDPSTSPVDGAVESTRPARPARNSGAPHDQ